MLIVNITLADLWGEIFSILVRILSVCSETSLTTNGERASELNICRTMPGDPNTSQRILADSLALKGLASLAERGSFRSSLSKFQQLLAHTLSRIELYWVVLSCAESYWAVLSCIALCWASLSCIEMCWVVLSCVELQRASLSFIEVYSVVLRCIQMCWSALSCVELCWVALTFVYLCPKPWWCIYGLTSGGIFMSRASFSFI